jgi:hypothetical protein
MRTLLLYSQSPGGVSLANSLGLLDCDTHIEHGAVVGLLLSSMDAISR